MGVNGYLSRLRDAQNEGRVLGQYSNERQVLDALILALNQEFGFGADRCGRLVDAYIAKRKELATMTMRDAKDDKEFWYAKEKMDRALQQVMGPSYPAFDDRYRLDLRKPLYEGGIVIK